MKKDIKTLPLAELAQGAKDIFAQESAEALQQTIAVARRRHARVIAAAVKRAEQYNFGEEGSDGLEEEAIESMGDFDESKISLDADERKDIWAAARVETTKKFIDKYKLQFELDWLMPQLMAYFGTWKAVADEDGKYSAASTMNANIVGDDYATGALLLALQPRGDFFTLGSTSKLRAPMAHYKSPYNCMVPLVLAGFKLYQNIKYSAWDRERIGLLVHADLSEAMLCEMPELSMVERLEIRNMAITDRTGARAGIPNNPATCAKLNHLQETAVASLPKIAKYWTTQTWAAHVNNFTPLQILDAENWDLRPEALVQHEILRKTAVSSVQTAEVEW